MSHASGENVLVEKPAAQMLWFWSAPMGGNFATQRHQQSAECLSHGPQPFVHLYSTRSLALLGMPAETQSWWSWDPRKEFGGSLQLEMERYSMMLWVFQVGLSCYPWMPLYPEAGESAPLCVDHAEAVVELLSPAAAWGSP